ISLSTLREATAIATSSKVMQAPPWVTANEFRCSGLGSYWISEYPPSNRMSSKPRWWTKGMSTPNRMLSACDDAHATVDCQPLPGDVLAGVRGEQQRNALEVLVVSQALERRMRGQLVLAQALQRTLRHLAREETWADGVHGDVVLAPFAAQGLGEADHGALGGVVGQRCHLGRS